MAYRVAFTRKSKNVKTGPIPVTTTESDTCPKSCGMFEACYAKGGPLAIFWRKVSDGTFGLDWAEFVAEIVKLPFNQLWRHNQAGDLPGLDADIDADLLQEIVSANRGKRGFTYTHKPLIGPQYATNREAVRHANTNGFTINLSADTLSDADTLSALDIGPVVVVLDVNQTTALRTPQGRHVAICPAAISDSVTCESCGVCAMADRKSIIGFPAHGARKRMASDATRSAPRFAVSVNGVAA